MNPRMQRLVLPVALVVTTIAVANACKGLGNDGDEPTYCEDIESMSACEDAAGCGWDAAADDCVNACHEILVQADCIAIERCEWGAAEGTGGGETCHEAFT